MKSLIEKLKTNLHTNPQKVSADSGYCSEENVTFLADQEIDGYVATDWLKHTDRPPSAPRGRIPQWATIKERIARKLQTAKGRKSYSKRKEIVEPIFGQIKQVRGFRQFLLRGFEKVSAE